MEFGIFIQTYLPEFDRTDADAEHRKIEQDLELAVAADRAGFKYIWVAEHHFLDEYSHMSANDVVLGYLAHATQRAHLGSGIFNPLPQVNHPAKVAERVAMLDHLSKGRFEFGTGRGAGSYEILAFLPDIKDLNYTKEIWAETIGEFPKMWMQDTYEGFQGKSWSLPPRKILPKPWLKPHPPMWYAAGNTPSYAMAAHKGLGVLGFSVSALAELEPVLRAYKAEIVNAEPIGGFVNDNVMVCVMGAVAAEAQMAREALLTSRVNYYQSNVFRYHDTFPRPAEVPAWPELIAPMTSEGIDLMVGAGSLICGDPADALKQCTRWADAGADQLVFGLGALGHQNNLEHIRLLGEHVIPHLDPDPVHRTTRQREAAASSR
jgi:alkanesulfonate monooxygenase SsuD/methylene tetrahydromethanopterin reductase-like flavin-dependent oxidoreductase (luciferase family)